MNNDVAWTMSVTQTNKTKSTPKFLDKFEDNPFLRVESIAIKINKRYSILSKYKNFSNPQMRNIFETTICSKQGRRKHSKSEGGTCIQGAPLIGKKGHYVSCKGALYIRICETVGVYAPCGPRSYIHGSK